MCHPPYDSNGNTTSKTDSAGTTNYTWDFENRLVSVTTPGTGGGTTSFKYDPFGRRIEKVSPTFTSIFAYDGDNLIETVNSTGAVVSRYAQTQNVDEPLAELRSGGVDYYEADGLGSVTSLTSTAGAVAQSYTNDSFGKQTSSSGSLQNPFDYTGREFDSETGLYYYRARYYDPTTGRFLSEDPIGFSGDGTDFYAYASNTPTYWADPTGETKKIPTDCPELYKYIQELVRNYVSKLDQYDPVEDGSGTIPKSGGGFYKPGVHYFNLFFLQVKLIKAIKYWDDHCGPGNQSPVCEQQRKLIQAPIPEPVYQPPVVEPDTGAKMFGFGVIAGEVLQTIGEYGWLFAF